MKDPSSFFFPVSSASRDRARWFVPEARVTTVLPSMLLLVELHSRSRSRSMAVSVRRFEKDRPGNTVSKPLCRDYRASTW